MRLATNKEAKNTIQKKHYVHKKKQTVYNILESKESSDEQ